MPLEITSTIASYVARTSRSRASDRALGVHLVPSLTTTRSLHEQYRTWHRVGTYVRANSGCTPVAPEYSLVPCIRWWFSPIACRRITQTACLSSRVDGQRSASFGEMPWRPVFHRAIMMRSMKTGRGGYPNVAAFGNIGIDRLVGWGTLFAYTLPLGVMVPTLVSQ